MFGGGEGGVGGRLMSPTTVIELDSRQCNNFFAVYIRLLAQWNSYSIFSRFSGRFVPLNQPQPLPQKVNSGLLKLSIEIS